MSDSLRPYGLQYARLPCPSLELANTHVHGVSDPSNHLIICCPFSSCPQSFPASGSFPVRSYGFSSSHVWKWELDCKESWVPKNWCFWTVVWRRLLRVPWTARRSNQSIERKSVLNIQWKDQCWIWNSNTSATWCKELTHWKRPWCWERLKAGGEGDDRGWDGWMASLTQWTWVWVSAGNWRWTGRPGVLQSMGSQRVGPNWVTELNWTGALHIRWPKYWSFSFSVSPSNEFSDLISFRIDWFDDLDIQGTLKSLL